MKKIIISALFGMFGMICLTGCSEKDNSPLPSEIDPATISYEAKPGAIKLKWAIPENADYEYIKVSYTLPDDNKKCQRLASIYSDTILIDNLLKRYGDMVFTLQPCTKSGKGGTVHTIAAQSLAAPIVSKEEKTKVNVDKNHVWTDSQEASEGPIANLVDGIEDNFFHMDWHTDVPFPHYIVMDLGTPISTFQFKYMTRKQNNDNPAGMVVLGSDTFDSKVDYTAQADQAQVISTFANDVLPSTASTAFQPVVKTANTPFRYIWFKITASKGGSPWISMAEMTVYKVKKSVYDPETGKTTVTQ